MTPDSHGNGQAHHPDCRLVNPKQNRNPPRPPPRPAPHEPAPTFTPSKRKTR
ncbi:hypothetical protein [Mobiluncus mulieris]|uniref:hypothetical protein n=1 Tax=Mobiluncus mulieris TaxID=2052 RepID=UPI0014705736|nr:hypothetical protein [Mobiluncus mulieris]NMX20761.1 hypothetical protein [Mobiluncus mulieris]